MVKRIGERLLALLNNNVMTDVTFLVQGEEVKCHRLVLISSESNLKDLVAEGRDKVRIDDVTPEIFKCILKFLYADDADVMDSNVFELMHVAKIFGMSDLEIYCSEFIQTKLTNENVCFFTSQALHFDAKESLKVCMDYFKTRSLEILSTNGILQSSQDALLSFCKIQDVQNFEVPFFSACIKWAKAECKRKNMEENSENMRAVLGDVVQQMPLERMEIDAFLNTVIPTNILTYEEIGRHIVKIQQMVEVTIHFGTPPYLRSAYSRRQHVSTTISNLKADPFWQGGQLKCTPDSFHLSYNGVIVEDHKTLADVQIPGKKLVFIAPKPVKPVARPAGFTFGSNQAYQGQNQNPFGVAPTFSFGKDPYH